MLQFARLITPRRQNLPAQADFEAAIQGHAEPDIVSDLIPSTCLNTYQPGVRTPDGGFKFEWNQPADNGATNAWVVWGHGRDTQAPVGEAAATEWTMRVKCNNLFLTYLSVGTGPGRIGAPTRWVAGSNAQFTHIPLTLPARTLGRVV
jgi:hypothetical protein